MVMAATVLSGAFRPLDEPENDETKEKRKTDPMPSVLVALVALVSVLVCAAGTVVGSSHAWGAPGGLPPVRHEGSLARGGACPQPAAPPSPEGISPRVESQRVSTVGTPKGSGADIHAPTVWCACACVCVSPRVRE